MCVLVLSSLGQTALASTDYQSTKDIIEKMCSGHAYQNNFLSGFNCFGEKSTIYYIGEKEVTRVVFEKEMKIYDEKGSICTERYPFPQTTFLRYYHLENNHGKTRI